MLDYGVFYEFMPTNNNNSSEIIPLEMVKKILIMKLLYQRTVVCGDTKLVTQLNSLLLNLIKF